MAASSQLDALNKHFEANTFVEGALATMADCYVFSRLDKEPCVQAHPHLARFYRHMRSFTPYQLINLPPSSSPLPVCGAAVPGAAPGAPGSQQPPAMKIGDIGFESAVEKNNHPPWYKPQGGDFVGLRVHNTLTEKGSGNEDLEPFIPRQGRRVLWYTCGPTVYDSCHMGHARAYLTFDILRRIVEDYFGYEVVYHVNITDIDDKIILRARRNLLVQQYTNALPTAPAQAFQAAHADIQAQYTAKQAKIAGAFEQLRAALEAAKDGAREKEEAETKFKEQTLKAAQFNTRRECCAVVHQHQTEGGDKTLAALVAEAKRLGINDASDLHGLVAAATKRVVDLQTTIEELSEANQQDDSKLEAARGELSRVDLVLSKANTALAAAEDPLAALLKVGNEELGEKLDSEKGHTITDHEVFLAHARKYEREYMEDMQMLGVRDADVLTRVTEYVDKIVDFIKVVVDRGFAYESQGSVYLDTEKFKGSGHHYRKLRPFHGHTSEDAMAESEGALGGGGEKRHPNDFALWKGAKRGEPQWESPWGLGRPGWHIECSVVAGDILGENIDVHAGGVDLKFPHHDNELAQSEARYGHHQWVNYFFHAGHLHIKGLKMSKSLKNFVTIRQALKEHSPRQLRLMFLLQPWDKPMNYSDQTVEDAKKKESLLKNYFGNVKSALREDWLRKPVGWQRGADDRALVDFGLAIERRVHEALCNNFDTRTALLALCELVAETNKYLEDKAALVAVPTLRKQACFITRILKVFGVVDGADDIGFPMGGGGDKESTIAPYVDALVQFRDKVREAARASGNKAMLELCDKMRDEDMVNLGVRLEDRVDEGSLWKLDDPAVLKKEVEEQKAKRDAAALKKWEAQQKKLKDEIAAAADAATPPVDLYRDRSQYSEWDSDGIPVKAADGTDVPKAASKKLKKAHATHAKKHSQLVDKAGGVDKIGEYVKGLEAELAALANAKP